MIVLVDLEWLENSKTQVTPTQIAAIRVDDEWRTVSEFNSLCRPRDVSFHQWGHMAYAGGTPDEFLSAAPARAVFDDFYNWIKPDDVLLWWAPEPPSVFSGLLKIISEKKLKNKSHHVRTAFEWFVRDGRKTKGGVYHLAHKRQIPLLAPEHCSLNDVRMMLDLLQNVGFNLEWVYTPIPSKEERQKVQIAKASGYQFLIECETGIAHVNGCEQLTSEALVVGCDSIETCLKHHAKPCATCCKQIWNERVFERNNDVIKRSQCNFFYLAKGRAFHRPTCWIVQNSTLPPMGTVYYDGCVKKGKMPCRICNPSPDEVQPIGKKKKKKALAKVQQSTGKPEITTTTAPLVKKKPLPTIQMQSMTMAEQQAMKRHRIAAKERDSIELSAMSGQERSDALTLTATRYAFWAVAGYSTFHIRSCPKLNGMSHIKGFSRYSEALHAGYKPCRHCKPTKKYDAVVSIPIYNKDRGSESVEEIIAFCNEQGFTCNYNAPMLILETGVGHWRIDTSKRPIFIEHKHIGDYKKKSTLHWQPRMFLSLADVIKYIVRHDIKSESDAK